MLKRYALASGLLVQAILLLVPTRFSVAQPANDHLRFDPQRLAEETLHYRLVSAGKAIGVASVAIRREVQNKIPLIRIVQSISGLFNQTTDVLLVADSTLRPISSYTSITQAAQTHAIRLNYQPGRVTGRLEIPPALGGHRRVDEFIAPGTMDFNAAEFVLRASELEMGSTIAFPVYHPQQGGRLQCHARVSRLEEIVVPAGTFHCRRVEVSLGRSQQTYYYDDRLPHRLILQRLPAAKVDIELLPLGGKGQI